MKSGKRLKNYQHPKARMRRIEFELMPYQEDFVFDTEHSEQGFTGGFRTGKSVAAVHKAIFLSALHRGKAGALLSPTYGMTKRNLLPIFRKLRDLYRLSIDGLSTANPSQVSIKWGDKISIIHLDISAENHDRLNGVTLAWAGLDEADKCLNPEVAETAWMQMGSRLSDPVSGEKGIRFATSTPEGFGFMYSTFCETRPDQTEEEIAKRRAEVYLYSASMLDNYMLPDSYVQQQLRALPKHLHKPYILGEFTNINKNVVYVEYDRELSHTDLSLRDVKPNEILHVGMDFNNNGMSAVGFVIRDEVAHVVYECIGSLNTRALATKMKSDLAGRNFVVYPDPACIQNKSSSDNTDLVILQQHGFRIQKMSTHPEVQDRVNSVNARFNNIKDERRLLVNKNTCPLTVKALLQQVYDSSGVPQKKIKLAGTAATQVDGPLDALGYAVFTLWPLRNQRASKITIQGF